MHPVSSPNREIPARFPRYEHPEDSAWGNHTGVKAAYMEATWKQPWNRRLMLRITLDDDVIDRVC